MKLTVLADNNSRIDRYLLAEPALSFFIEEDNKAFLFDCGYSDVFIKNSFKLNINLRQIDYIILSHGHNDHTGGLFYISQLYRDLIDLNIEYTIPNVIAHPNVFNQKIDNNLGNIGCPISSNSLQKIMHITFTKSPYWLTNKLCFLGEIPQKYTYQNDCLDDSALVYKSTKGLIVITGCSHAGLKNIIDYSIEVTNERNVYAVLGGLHLLNSADDDIIQLSSYLSKNHVKEIYPCHCCDFHSKYVLAKYNKVYEVCVGDSFEFI